MSTDGDAAGVDEPDAPEPASSTAVVPGPNQFVDNARRRIPGMLHLLIGVAALVAWLIRSGHDPVLVNVGTGIAGIGLIVFGAYSIFAGIALEVDEEDALRIAAVAVQRPMGHAAAQMGWRGWASRPTWRILWYSAEDPPRHRGLVLVDGHDGAVLESLVEANPEVDPMINWRLDDEQA